MKKKSARLVEKQRKKCWIVESSKLKTENKIDKKRNLNFCWLRPSSMHILWLKSFHVSREKKKSSIFSIRFVNFLTYFYLYIFIVFLTIEFHFIASSQNSEQAILTKFETSLTNCNDGELWKKKSWKKKLLKYRNLHSLLIFILYCLDNDTDALKERALANAKQAYDNTLNQAHAFDEEVKKRQKEVEAANAENGSAEIGFANPSTLSESDVLAQPKMFTGNMKSYQLKGMSWLMSLYNQVSAFCKFFFFFYI